MKRTSRKVKLADFLNAFNILKKEETTVTKGLDTSRKSTHRFCSAGTNMVAARKLRALYIYIYYKNNFTGIGHLIPFSE